MTMRPRARSLALAIVLIACGRNDVTCVVPPCVMSIAVNATVTSASATVPLPSGVFLVYTYNGASGTGFCSTGTTSTCELPGPGGTYQIAIGAPGFQTVNRTATVTAPPPANCGCSLAQTQHFDIALVPTS